MAQTAARHSRLEAKYFRPAGTRDQYPYPIGRNFSSGAV